MECLNVQKKWEEKKYPIEIEWIIINQIKGVNLRRFCFLWFLIGK
jgi:hypothetical protein